MKDLITQYINTQKHAWSKTSIRSETARLNAVADILDGNPERLWLQIQKLKPYTRSTVWTRVTNFYDFLLEEELREGHNPYRKWRKRNAKQFKHVYQKTAPKDSYEEAQTKVAQIKDSETREKAFQLLKGGLRWSESLQISEEGTVVGKGGKVRRVYTEPVKYSKSYGYFRKQLALIGLKPHDLRKIRATDLARRGMKEADLCAIMGWSSFQTASSYIAPLNEDKIEEIMTDGI